MRILLAWVIVFAALLAPWASAQSNSAAAQWEQKRLELQIEQSQRHLKYGLDLRKQGMTIQAAAEIIRAAELGRGRNPGATAVLSIMRQYDAAFWKRYGSRASPAKVEMYDKKARGLAATEDKEILELANWANSKKLENEAQEVYLEILLRRDEALEFDAKDQIVLPAGTIPKDASARIKEGAIAINGRWYVRDELLAKLPELKQVFEVSSAELRVRTTTTEEQARELHNMCVKLLPALALDLGASSQRRLSLLVFGKRAEYEMTCDALGYGGHKVVTGLASSSPLVALVCAEETPAEVLNAVCLHELTHLFCFAVSHSVFPPWYTEGFAETFGGADTFRWDGAKLTVAGMFARERIDALKLEGGTLPLAQMFATDPLTLWTKSKDAGLAFYAQAWAFVRYLRTGAGAEIAARFDQWETRCIGQALGFELGAKRSTQSGPAGELFLELFGKDLPKLEIGFQAWLREL